MSFQPKSDAVLNVSLKVQSLVLKTSDNEVVSTSGVTATIELGETISEIRSAIFVDDSAGTAAPVTAANRAVSGTQVVLTLSAAMAAADAIKIDYVVAE